jgi:hypothetical protein
MALGSGIRDPEKNLFRIPDPGVKKAPDILDQHGLGRQRYSVDIPRGGGDEMGGGDIISQ